MNRCPYCMSQLKQERCPLCGYPEIDIPSLRGTLPIGTVLQDRYEVGMPLETSFQSIAYTGLDTQTDRNVLITEFFPKKAVRRQGAEVVASGNAERFRDARLMYLSEKKNRILPYTDRFTQNNTAYRVYDLPDPLQGRDMASQIMNVPVLFRDERGNARMSINTLTIPPFPQKTEWKMASGILRYRRSRRLRTTMIALLCTLLLGGGLFLAYEMLTPKQVMLTVSDLSGQAVQPSVELYDSADLSAKLDVEPVAVYPIMAGDVNAWVYEYQLKRGDYTIQASSNAVYEDAEPETTPMSARLERYKVISHATPQMEIQCTPLIAVVVKDDEWLLRRNDEITYHMADGTAERVAPERVTTPLYSLHVQGMDSLQAEGWTIALKNRKHPRYIELDGSETLEVSQGMYDLCLVSAERDERVLAALEKVDDSAAVTLDAEALNFFMANYAAVGQLHAETPLMIVDGVPYQWAQDSQSWTAFDLTEVRPEKLAAWCERYPSLFGAFSLTAYTVLPDEIILQYGDPQTTVNGLPLASATEGYSLWTNAQVKQLELAYHVNGKLQQPVNKPLDPEAPTVHLDAPELKAAMESAQQIYQAVIKDAEGKETKIAVDRDGRRFDPAVLEQLAADEEQFGKLLSEEEKAPLVSAVIVLSDRVRAEKIASIQILFGDDGAYPLSRVGENTFTAPAGSYTLAIEFTEETGRAKQLETVTISANTNQVVLLEEEAADAVKPLTDLAEAKTLFFRMEDGSYWRMAENSSVSKLERVELPDTALFKVTEEATMIPLQFRLDPRLKMLNEEKPYQTSLTWGEGEKNSRWLDTVQLFGITHSSQPITEVKDITWRGENKDTLVEPDSNNSYVLFSGKADEEVDKLHFWGPSDADGSLEGLTYFSEFQGNRVYFSDDPILEERTIQEPAPDQYGEDDVRCLVYRHRLNDEDVFELVYTTMRPNAETGVPEEVSVAIELACSARKMNEPTATPMAPPTATPTAAPTEAPTVAPKDADNSASNKISGTEGDAIGDSTDPEADSSDRAAEERLLPSNTPDAVPELTPSPTPAASIQPTKTPLFSKPTETPVITSNRRIDYYFYFVAPEGDYRFRVTNHAGVYEGRVKVDADGATLLDNKLSRVPAADGGNKPEH